MGYKRPSFRRLYSVYGLLTFSWKYSYIMSLAYGCGCIVHAELFIDFLNMRSDSPWAYFE